MENGRDRSLPFFVVAISRQVDEGPPLAGVGGSL
jgi:hypothetical protein